VTLFLAYVRPIVLELEHNARCDDLKSYPSGFRLVMSTIPGTIEVSNEQVKSEYRKRPDFRAKIEVYCADDK
jgi:hypothetical protein